MEDAGFIIGSYALTFGGIAAYALAVLTRSRRMAKRVADEDKPWI